MSNVRKSRAGARVGLAGLLLVLSLAAGPAALAAEIEGVSFRSTVDVGGARLVLANVGLLRSRLVVLPIKAYVGAFYVGEGIDPERWRDDVPKRLELHYFWAIPGEKFGPAGEQVLAQNVSPQTMERLRPALARIAALYVDVQPGDRYALTYLPGKGTELSKNGEPLGVVEGAEFASTYLQIWLGPNPIDGAFRDALLASR